MHHIRVPCIKGTEGPIKCFMSVAPWKTWCLWCKSKVFNYSLYFLASFDLILLIWSNNSKFQSFQTAFLYFFMQYIYFFINEAENVSTFFSNAPHTHTHRGWVAKILHLDVRLYMRNFDHVFVPFFCCKWVNKNRFCIRGTK